MRLPARLAFRYIVKRRSGTLVHVISGISVLVIAAVTTAMVAILSAFNGIEDLYGTIVATVLGVLVLASCWSIVNNVQQFRNMYSQTTSSTPALRWWPKVGHIDPPPPTKAEVKAMDIGESESRVV